jgi:hypothetical protein
MGAGILPTAIYKDKLYFLFGKENKFADTPGFSDFGGGTDNDETFLQTAIREGTEELTGFLGSKNDLQKILKRGTYNIDFNDYRMHIFPIQYDDLLPFYYNNNQQFLQQKLHDSIIEKSKIFEKAEIKWICVNDILKIKSHFRSYFQHILPIIYNQKAKIYAFIRKSKITKTNTQRRRFKKYNQKTRRYYS